MTRPEPLKEAGLSAYKDFENVATGDTPCNPVHPTRRLSLHPKLRIINMRIINNGLKELLPSMRRIVVLPAYVVALGLCYIATIGIATAQTQTVTSDKVEYTVELPSPTWRVVTQPDGVQQHMELVYGDRSDGFLRIRKEVVDQGATATDLARRDQEQKLRYAPGYVEGKQEKFVGRTNGGVASYEYTNAGKPMAGRIYYLQTDPRAIYTLHFTGARDKLLRIRSQTDFIARSFQLK